MAKPFFNSQNIAILLPHLAEKIERETMLPAVNIERLERMVNELKSCADSVLKLAKKDKAQVELVITGRISSKD